MTTLSNLSTIMEIKLRTIDKYKKIKQMDIELVCPALLTTMGVAVGKDDPPSLIQRGGTEDRF